MTPPKKPGTDLSALKARLAKKAGGGPSGPAPAAAAVPPPGQPAPKKPAADIPAPGQPAPKPVADIPAPGEVKAKPAVNIPAPGEVSKPAPAQPVAAAAPAKPKAAGDAFGGGGASFDPNEGLIADVGGDFAPKGNKGIVVMAALGALVFGVALGWVLNTISSKGKMVEVGKAKGATMVKEVQEVADLRKKISLKMDDLAKQLATDPAAGAKELKALNDSTFEQHPKVSELFGWQLAAVHPTGIQKTFELYEQANGLKTDLSYLTTFVENYADALKEGSGPRVFAVKFNKGEAYVVARAAAICGDAPCEPGKEGSATALQIIEKVGEEPATAEIGTGDGQVMPIAASGAMYGYIIGLKPENNASAVFGSLLKRVQERLEAMNTAESRALKALKNYSDDPDVDGSGQPEPGE
ncbi:MAG: hypothetical protein R3A79_17660 [Nannocystaceae bacterium]